MVVLYWLGVGGGCWATSGSWIGFICDALSAALCHVDRGLMAWAPKVPHLC